MLVFLSLVSVFVCFVLIYASLGMMKSDLKDGYERLIRLEKSTLTEIGKLLEGEFDEDWKTVEAQSSLLDEKSSDRALELEKIILNLFLEQMK